MGQYIYFLADVMKENGDGELGKKLTDGLSALVDLAGEAAEATEVS